MRCRTPTNLGRENLRNFSMEAFICWCDMRGVSVVIPEREVYLLMFDQVQPRHDPQHSGLAGHLAVDPVSLLGAVGVALDEDRSNHVCLLHLGHGLGHCVSSGGGMI